jgi:hypothetical protein
MTREEIIKLLDIVSATYPHAKIKDPSALVSAWELTLGDFSAEAVYKATRYHLETNKYFPSPSDIRENIVRAELIYKTPIPNAIESRTNRNDDENLELFCQWIGFGYEEDDNVELPKGFLHYEI